MRRTFIGCACHSEAPKRSKHGIEGLISQVRGGAPIESAPRDLKPNAHDDIGSQLHVHDGHTLLGDHLREVLLEMHANPGTELSR